MLQKMLAAQQKKNIVHFAESVKHCSRDGANDYAIALLVHSKKTEPWQPQLVGWYERRPLHDPNEVFAFRSKKKTPMFGAKTIVLFGYWVLFPAAAVWTPLCGRWKYFFLSCNWAFSGFMAVIFQGGVVR